LVSGVGAAPLLSAFEGGVKEGDSSVEDWVKPEEVNDAGEEGEDEEALLLELPVLASSLPVPQGIASPLG
jgi:hypothetical protein